jgi:hypothetical protein
VRRTRRRRRHGKGGDGGSEGGGDGVRAMHLALLSSKVEMVEAEVVEKVCVRS